MREKTQNLNSSALIFRSLPAAKKNANTFERRKKKDTHTRINSQIALVKSEQVKVNFVINSFTQLAFDEF